MSQVELSKIEQLTIGSAFNEAIASIKRRKLHKNPNDPLFKAMPIYEGIAAKFTKDSINERFGDV